MTDNPFTFGNPITDPARFIGRAREIEQVFSRLRNTEFESSSIVGERRIGKTSLLKYMANETVIRQQRLDPDRYLFLFDDLLGLGRETRPARFWERLLRKIQRRVKNDDLKDILDEVRATGEIDNYTLADFFDIIDEQGLHVVILFDEFENVTNNPNFGPDFFGGLRSLAIHHNLALVTSSRRELIELSHSEEVRSSPFFNIFANINLRGFSRDEAQQLITRYLAGTGVTFEEGEVENLFTLAGYHPCFLQMAASFLFQAYAEKLDYRGRESAVRREFWEKAGPFFRDYWKHSSLNEQIMLVALALASQKQPADSRGLTLRELEKLYGHSQLTLSELEKRGLVMEEEGCYRLFSTMFGQWIRQEIARGTGGEAAWETWREANRKLLARLPGRVRDDVLSVLPQANSQYTELLGNWLLEPTTAGAAAALLKDFLGSYVPPREAGGEEAAADAAERQSEIAHLKKLLKTHRHTLRKLELDAARYGTDVPVKLANDMDSAREKIRGLEKRLHSLPSGF